VNQLTSPCSRRAAARRHPRRERPGPRPAAEGQLVRPRMEAVLRMTVLVSSVVGALLGCSAGSAAMSGERRQSEVHYYTVAGLAEGPWRATPMRVGEQESVGVELGFSPLLPSPSQPRTSGPFPLGTITITSDAWVAQVHVYDIERTEGDEFSEPQFIVKASESEAIPLNLADAPEWRFILTDTYEGGFMSRVPAGARHATDDSQTKLETEGWVLRRERADR
jgi:hypothetical protein